MVIPCFFPGIPYLGYFDGILGGIRYIIKPSFAKHQFWYYSIFERFCGQHSLYSFCLGMQEILKILSCWMLQPAILDPHPKIFQVSHNVPPAHLQNAPATGRQKTLGCLARRDLITVHLIIISSNIININTKIKIHIKVDIFKKIDTTIHINMNRNMLNKNITTNIKINITINIKLTMYTNISINIPTSRRIWKPRDCFSTFESESRIDCYLQWRTTRQTRKKRKNV